mmetsp:Transcript_27793/g.40946  ORF Transcript_27793/g.40946 Transcript_27793/m.40946 type:complete len:294 (-) Transcript_27793:607-1488(-)
MDVQDLPMVLHDERATFVPLRSQIVFDCGRFPNGRVRAKLHHAIHVGDVVLLEASLLDLEAPAFGDGDFHLRLIAATAWAIVDSTDRTIAVSTACIDASARVGRLDTTNANGIAQRRATVAHSTPSRHGISRAAGHFVVRHRKRSDTAAFRTLCVARLFSLHQRKHHRLRRSCLAGGRARQWNSKGTIKDRVGCIRHRREELVFSNLDLGKVQDWLTIVIFFSWNIVNLRYENGDEAAKQVVVAFTRRQTLETGRRGQEITMEGQVCSVGLPIRQKLHFVKRGKENVAHRHLR